MITSLISSQIRYPGLAAQETEPRSNSPFFERYSDWPEDLKIQGTLLVAESIEGLKPFLAELNRSPSKPKQWVVVGPHKLSQMMLGDPGIESTDTSATASSAIASLERLTWTQKLDAVPEPDPQSMLLVCDDRLAHEIPDEFWSSAADTMRRYLAIGATVGFIGPASVAMGKTYNKPDPESHQNAPKLAQGLGLFPDAWIHFTDQGDCEATLCQAMQADARTVLIGISKDRNTRRKKQKRSRKFPPGLDPVATPSDRAHSGDLSPRRTPNPQCPKRHPDHRRRRRHALRPYATFRRPGRGRTSPIGLCPML